MAESSFTDARKFSQGDERVHVRSEDRKVASSSVSLDLQVVLYHQAWLARSFTMPIKAWSKAYLNGMVG